MTPLRTVLALAFTGGVAFASAPASAQVAYGVPYEYGYGYPVPGGVLQPDETAGSSLSFDIAPHPYGYAPVVRVIQRCQYPDGWNVTDFSRDVNGTPAGIDHTCPYAVYPQPLRARPVLTRN